MTYYLVKFWVQKLSNLKKHGRNKQRVFLDVFSPPENESKVHLPVKKLFLALESWWTFAVRNYIQPTCSLPAAPVVIIELIHPTQAQYLCGSFSHPATAQPDNPYR